MLGTALGKTLGMEDGSIEAPVGTWLGMTLGTHTDKPGKLRLNQVHRISKDDVGSDNGSAEKKGARRNVRSRDRNDGILDAGGVVCRRWAHGRSLSVCLMSP